MFGLLKKKKKITNKDYDFLSRVVDELPSKYSYLKKQVSKDFILNKKINELGSKGTFTLTLNANLESTFSNKKLPNFFILKDISIWNNQKEKFENIELHILEGMLAGFMVKSNYENLDLKKIIISNIKEKHFKNEDKLFLLDLIKGIPNEVKSELDIQSTFKIEIPEGDFYVVKDFEDGNYLSMDNKGAVYGMIHDPYEIEQIFNNKEKFFEALKSGEFSISEYYSKKV